MSGRLELSGTDSGWPTNFYPDGVRFFTARKSVPLANGQQFLGCIQCGLVWSQVDPEELVELLQKRGTAQAQAAIAESKKKPP